MQRFCYIIIILLATFVAFGDLVICRKCGHEAEQNVTACGHCGAVLSKTKKSTSTSSLTTISDDSTDSEGYLDSVFVKNEVLKGKKYLSDGKPDIAFFLFKNASALNVLTKADDDNRRSVAINDLIKKSESEMRIVLRGCKKCQGTGKATFFMNGLSGSGSKSEKNNRSNKRAAVYKKCSSCAGKGKVIQRANVETLKVKYGRGLSKYRTMQKSQRLTSVGGAWLDPVLAESLTLEQVVALRQASVPPCDDCVGTGTDDCRKCDGTGTDDCSESSCGNGLVANDTGGSLEGSAKLKRMEKCSTCFGKGLIICEKCNGRGGSACRSCKGTGEREICRKCKGPGLVDCRRCRGSGSYKGDPCYDCKEAGQMKCSSCDGDGRKE